VPRLWSDEYGSTCESIDLYDSLHLAVQGGAHSVRWTDGALETKFSKFRWADKEAATLTMVGDKVEFQNGFGAFTPMIYACDLAADGKTVLAVRAQEGRLK